MKQIASKTFTLLVTLALALALQLPATPAAAIDFGFNHFAVHGGINTSSDWDNGTTLGLSVNFAELTDGLYLAAGVFYSEADTTECALFLGGTCSLSVDLDVENLAVGAELRYFFRGEPRGFYVGGGPYLNQLDLETVVGAPGPLGGTQTVVLGTSADRVGILGVAGYKLGRGLAEVRYNTVSDFNSVQLLIGFSFGGGR